MAKMAYVKVFVTFLDDMERLNFEERGRLITAMLYYAKTEEEMDLPGMEGILWPNAKRLMDDEAKKYQEMCERNKKNRAHGSIKQASQDLTTRDQEQEQEKEHEQEYEQEQEQEQEYEQEQEQEQEYCDTVVSQVPAPGGAHERAQNKFCWEGYGEELSSTLDAWLAYKSERGQHYRKTGFDALKSQVEEAVSRYGEAAVAAVIRQSMAANYHCITFDRLGRDAARPQYTPHPSSVAPSPDWREDVPSDAYSEEVRAGLRKMGLA